MLIDWFTVGAQTINFLILVWLLKRFLYQPILDAIDVREQRIATELADAEMKKAEAQRERDRFQLKNQEFDQQRDALFSQAKNEAKAERLRLLEQARTDAATLNSKRQESLRQEQLALQQAISRRAQQEVFDIARKVLADLAGVSLEERMVDVFVRQLQALNSDAKDELTTAIQGTSHPVTVRTTFELQPDQCATINNAIKQTLKSSTAIHFETSPELISGIELSTDGRKVVWSIADYLTSLENGFREILKEKANVIPR